MNIRAQVTCEALKHLSDVYPDKELNVVEVGCMFNKGEGLSTYIIADFLAKRPSGGRLVSIECDPSHIVTCKELIDEYDPTLTKHIEYRQGYSLAVLPKVLAELGSVHLFSLDGGGHPEVCLGEFELALANLATDGIIIEDDVQPMAPTEHYKLPRTLGKATLILPMLILANYIENRGDKQHYSSVTGNPDSVSYSALIPQLTDIKFPANIANFLVLGISHRMLLYGSRDFISKIEKIKFKNPQPAAMSFKYIIKQKLIRLLS
jgi:predicted O-methyltransferase YrrM